MTKKRKHYVVVEITLEEPCTEKEAINELRHNLNVARANSEQVDAAVTVWNVKSFQRVTTALRHNWVKKAQRQYTGESVYHTLSTMRNN